MWFQARAITHFILLLWWSISLPVHRQWSRSKCQWSTAVKRLWHLVMDAAVPRAGKFLLPVMLSQHCVYLELPQLMEGPMKDKVEAQTTVTPGTPESSPWDWRGDPAPAALQGEPELAQGRQQDQPARSCKGKNGKSKANLLFLGTGRCCRPRGSLNSSLRNYSET